MVETKTIKTNPEGTKVSVELSLGDVLCMHLDGVMVDPTKMQALEADIDAWIKRQSDRTMSKRNEILSQLKRGMGCLESIYSRLAQSY